MPGKSSTTRLVCFRVSNKAWEVINDRCNVGPRIRPYTVSEYLRKVVEAEVLRDHHKGKSRKYRTTKED